MNEQIDCLKAQRAREPLGMTQGNKFAPNVS